MKHIVKAIVLKAVILKVTALASVGLTLQACEPEVGSERWCEKMKDKARGDWTFQETADYARHCVLR